MSKYEALPLSPETSGIASSSAVSSCAADACACAMSRSFLSRWTAVDLGSSIAKRKRARTQPPVTMTHSRCRNTYEPRNPGSSRNVTAASSHAFSWSGSHAVEPPPSL